MIGFAVMPTAHVTIAANRAKRCCGAASASSTRSSVARKQNAIKLAAQITYVTASVCNGCTTKISREERGILETGQHVRRAKGWRATSKSSNPHARCSRRLTT